MRYKGIRGGVWKRDTQTVADGAANVVNSVVRAQNQR